MQCIGLCSIQHAGVVFSVDMYMCVYSDCSYKHAYYNTTCKERLDVFEAKIEES